MAGRVVHIAAAHIMEATLPPSAASAVRTLASMASCRKPNTEKRLDLPVPLAPMCARGHHQSVTAGPEPDPRSQGLIE